MCRYRNNKARASRPPPETEKTESTHLSQAGEDPKKLNHHPNRLEPFHNHGKTIHKCDQCNRQFLYEYGLKRHIRSDHLHKKTVFEPFTGFGYFGKVKKPDKKPRRIKGEIEEIIVANDKLKIVSMNVFSLVPVEKKLFVRNGILDSKADVIAISETKFSPHTAEFQVPGYYQAAAISRKAGAGGLLIMAKNTIRLHAIVVKNVDKDKHIQTIEFEFNKHKFIAVYRSPTVPEGTTEKAYHKCLIDFLDSRIKKFNAKNNPYTLFGDFNLGTLAACNFDPEIKTYIAAEDGKNGLPPWETMWADFYTKHCLEQWVLEPTFPRYGSILDLVLTPNDQVVDNLTVEKELFQGKGFDHYGLMFDINTSYETNETPRTRRVKTKKNWDKFRQLLIEAKIMETCPTGNVDEMTNHIVRIIQECYNEAIPLVFVKPGSQCYLQKETKIFIKRQTKLRSRRRKLEKEGHEGSPAHTEVKRKLELIDISIDQKVKSDREQFQIRQLEVSKEKNKNLFAHVKAAKSKPSVNIIGPVIDMEGNLRTSDQDIANSFSNLMGEQLKSDEKPNINWDKPHPKSSIPWSKSINCLIVGRGAIIKQIKKSRKNAAVGPDGIPMDVFSVAKDILIDPLVALFNCINQSGDVPQHFKEARVKMLYKKGEKTEMLHYRPLAMANHLAKLWERVVNCELIGHLEQNGLLSQFQYGFRPGRGAAENLMELWEHVVDRVEAEKSHIELWSLDLTKAFDKLNHAKVLNLVHKSGIYGSMGRSIQNWLTERSQYVEVGNCKSQRTRVNKSCIQGSVMGPSLWLMYINTLLVELDEAGVKYFAYADDVAIVQRLDTEEDKKEFEEILNILQKWADNYDMAWSPLKTQRLVFAYPSGPKVKHEPLEMFFGGKKIEPLEKECISLGIQIEANCTFMSQIKKVKNQIRTLTALVHKNFANLTQALLERYYQVYVMPSLIYCCQIWHGGDETILRDIEAAIKNFWNLSPTGPPEDFIGPRILLIIFDLNYAKKMWDGTSAVDFNKMYKIEEDENTRENEDEILRKRSHNIKCSRLRFSMRTRNYWNLLPKEIRHLEYHFFKREAKKFVINNQDRFLNYGNKDKTHPKYLDPIVPYVPPEHPSKRQPSDNPQSKEKSREKSKEKSKEKSNGKHTIKLENWWRPRKRKNVPQKGQKVKLNDT